MFGLMAKEWENLSSKEKAKFDKDASVDQQRYERELADLIKNGFFIYEKDGKSSADVQKKIKKAKKNEEEDEEAKVPKEKIEKVKRKKD